MISRPARRVGQAGVPTFSCAVALFISMWGHVHGLVVLEVFGHTDFLGAGQAGIFGNTMLDLLAGAHRRIPGR